MSFVIKIEKRMQLFLFALLVALIFFTVNCPNIVGASANMRLLPIYSVDTGKKQTALTINAAWDNADIETLLSIFEKYNVKITFFAVGDWVDKYPKTLKQIYDAGHEIMNHSDDHAHFSKLDTAIITANINACNDKIERITGSRPTMFRAPYGEYDDHVIAAVNAMGMYPIQWDVDSLDWKGLSAEEMFKRVTEKISPGSIVLFHSGAKHTPEALEAIIEHLIKTGYEIVPVSRLIITGDYSIDHTGKQRAS